MNTNAQTYPSLNFLSDFHIDGNNSLIKAYVNWRAKNAQKKNAKQSILCGFEHCIRGIDALDRTLGYLNDGIILLFGADIPLKLKQDLKTISTVELQNTHLYLGYVASVEIISKRYKAIESLIGDLRASSTKKCCESLVLQNQLRELKRDFIILAETDLLLLEKIFPTHKGMSLKQMKNRLYKAA